MERTRYTARDFAQVVRGELKLRDKWGIRTLARKCDEVHGGGVEMWRRGLNRWLNEGIRPSRENRRDVCEALGWERDTFDDEDDEEADQAVVKAMQAIDSLLLERAKAAFRLARQEIA